MYNLRRFLSHTVVFGYVEIRFYLDTFTCASDFL